MRTTRTAAAAGIAACLFIAGCGGGGGSGGRNETVTVTAPAGGGAASVTIDAYDVYFKPKFVKAPAGKLEIHYVEQGSQQHTLLVEGVKGFKLTVDQGQKSETGSVDLTAGTYTFFCDIPGHRAQGMVGTITVTS